MLFIPFFENGFKHGNIDSKQQGFLRSILVCENGNIEFNIKNKVATKDAKND